MRPVWIRVTRPEDHHRSRGRLRFGWVVGVAAVVAVVLTAGAFAVTGSNTITTIAGGGSSPARVRAEGSGDASIAKKRKPNPILPASAFILPSANQCVRGRTLTIRLRRLQHVTWAAANVYVNRRHFKTIKRSQFTRPVKLTGLPTGRFVLRITAKATDGRSVTARRTYRTCVTKTPPSPHTLSVVLAGSGSGGVTGSGIACPGTCSKSYAAGTVVTLTASPGSGSSFGGWSGGGCSGTGTCTVTMSADQSVTATFSVNPPPPHTLSVVLAGSGSGGVTGSGIACPGTCSKSYAAGTVVTLTVSPGSGSSFSGWSGGGCSGTGTCTVTMSADQSVTATFTASPPSPPPPGSYSGATSQGYGVSLFVSADSTQLQDVKVPTQLGCTPSKTFNDQLQFASIAIAADGSFSGTATQTGVLFGATAQFTYTFAGQFTGTAVTGSFREDITFNDGTAYSCTTNIQTWSASRDAQGSQTASPPPPGSYSGATSQGYGVSLFVSADSTQLQDVKVSTALGCTPSKSFGDQLQFASIAIAADGSFSGTRTRPGCCSE